VEKKLGLTTAAYAASLALVLVACTGENSMRRPSPPAGSPAQLSGDGRYFGYIRSATVDPPTIRFDVAQAFSGKAANRAAAEDGVVPPGEPVPNDHYERNPDQQVVVLQVAADAWTPTGPLLGRQTKAKLDDFLAAFSDPRQKNLDSNYRGIHSQYWVTIEDGRVVRVDEQYFP
jgi:hypothetical protein